MATKRSVFLGFVMVLLFACRKNDAPVNALPEDERWILDSMQMYYYWNEQMPSQPASSSPAATFFKSLLHPADRFSYLEDPSVVRTEYSSFAYYGFEYELITLQHMPGKLFGVVTLVVPGSASARKGLKRGDCFTAVNNIPINAVTAVQVTGLLKQGQGVQLQLAIVDGSLLIGKETLYIPIAHFQEQPVYIARVFGDAAKKTGYLFYNYFDSRFDKKLLDSIGKLKAAGVAELILDLRYNPGGDVSAAAKISAVVAPVGADQLFVVYEANKNGGRFNNSFQETMRENDWLPNDFATVSQYRLSLTRVIVLTTKATASSAELVINALRPYIPVIQIGGQTLGKDMAGFAISDQRVPQKVPYILHPLVFKLYNASGHGDYPNGLSPDYPVDEFSKFPLQEFGSPEDPLISKALEITGTAPVIAARTTARQVAVGHEYSSAGARSRSLPAVGKRKFKKQ